MTAFTVILFALQATQGASDPTASAFRDGTARAILMRSRAARLAHDSALAGYDVRAHQRVSVGYGPARVGRDRMQFAYESVGRVRWRMGRGALIALEGARSRGLVGDLTPPIPYYTGVEALWIDAGPLNTVFTSLALVHPLIEGAEAHYLYETGDSLTLRLRGQRPVTLRELRIRPRVPGPELVVGSFWFDAATGQLVRAAYRPSAAVNLWRVIGESGESTGSGDFFDAAKRSAPRGLSGLLRRFFTDPASMKVAAVAVEYGLYEERFWLPRSRFVEIAAQAGFMAGTVRAEQRFSYLDVNGRDTIPAMVTESGRTGLLIGDRGDSATACSSRSEYTVTSRWSDVPVAIVVPCDRSALSRSAKLPPSIFSDLSDATTRDRDALIAGALSLDDQPLFPCHDSPDPIFRLGLPGHASTASKGSRQQHRSTNRSVRGSRRGPLGGSAAVTGGATSN